MDWDAFAEGHLDAAHEVSGRVHAGELVHDQAGVVRVADHQLRQRRLAGLDLALDAKAHLAQARHRRRHVLARRGGTAARGLDEAGGHVELAGVHLGDRAHVGVGVDAHPGLDVGAPAGRREVEGRAHRRGVVVDHQVHALDVAVGALFDVGADRDRHDRGVLRTLGRFEGEDGVGGRGDRAILEHHRAHLLPGGVGLGVVGIGRLLRQRRAGKAHRDCGGEQQGSECVHASSTGRWP